MMGKFKFSMKHLLLLIPAALFFFQFKEGFIFFVVFFAVAGVFVFIFLKIVASLYAPTLKLQNDFMKAVGFVPCGEEESLRLKEIVGWFKPRVPPDRFYLTEPVKAEINGKTVFQYFYNEKSQGASIEPSKTRAFREFEMVIPFPRRSSEPVCVILKRKDGVGKALQKAAEKLLPLSMKFMSSKDLPSELLKLPPELENGEIAVIMGAPNRAVYDLVNPKELDAITRGAEVNVESFMAGNDVALLCFAGGYVTENAYSKLPAYIAELMSRENCV